MRHMLLGLFILPTYTPGRNFSIVSAISVDCSKVKFSVLVATGDGLSLIPNLGWGSLVSGNIRFVSK